jgi:hypothetical protein
MTINNVNVSIVKIREGKDTGMSFGAIGAGYVVELSNETLTNSNDDDLLDRYPELRHGGRKSLERLNEMLVNKPWNTSY